ncbi:MULTISPECIES: DUF305 domain-containing protein [unclassified Streptomyces]|uniref:DUF305 domain-containing protein n=1 Tax=unclassified Streptomyces TaxID=2593676 RepID=UPI0033333760
MKPAPALITPALGLFLPLALVSSLLLAGCSEPSAPAATPTPSARPALSGATATDTGWIQLLIPMDDQAGQLLELAADRASAPRLATWAVECAEDHGSELARLRVLLLRMGLPDTNVHRGHDMPGMVTEADLARGRRLTGAAFDRFVLQELRDHLGQSRRVSRSAARSAGSGEVRRLAARIADTRTGQLRALPHVQE